MLDFLKSIFGPHVSPMNTIRIRKSSILHNLEYLQSLQPTSAVFPVLKSNAYGHGLKQLVKILRNVDVPYVVVDSYPEYQIVKKHSDHHILVLWETLPTNYRWFDVKRTAFAVYNMDTLKALGRRNKHVKVHLFLNTGMNREWIDIDNLKSFLEELKNYPHITVDGVMSHFHSADLPDQSQHHDFDTSTIEQQIQMFKKAYYQILEYGHAPRWRHIGNSASMFKLKEDFFNAWRPGLSLYGYSPLEKEDPAFVLTKPLRPALELRSTIVSTHIVWPGDWVSYGHKYKHHDREVVAAVPFGYAEWFSRVASGKLTYIIWKKKLPQIGTICMNLSSFLIDEKIHVWDEVQLISADQKMPNTIYALADASETIVYECLTRLDKGIRREID